MASRALEIPPRYRAFVGLIILMFGAYELFKMYEIRRMRGEITQLETQLGKGQESWREFPALAANERRDLRKAEERLFHLLPTDKDIPLLLQEISRLGRDYSLSDVAFSTTQAADAATKQPGQPDASSAVVSQAPVAQPIGPQQGQPETDSAQPGSGPIDSFPLKVSFSGDYREIAYFLEALQKLPRLVTVQSLKMQRAVPQVTVELVLRAYYQKGELPAAMKK